MTVAARASRTTAWTIPAYRYLLGSEAASLSGSAVSTIALPALAILELHASTWEVASLAFLGQLPSTLALWAGALSDRYTKRTQLILSDLAAAAALATVPAAALAGMLTVGQLYGVTLVLGAAKVVHDAAGISLLPSIVAPHLLHDANSRLGAASSVADSAGSNAGAALVGAMGPARSVLADVVSFLISATLVWRIPAPEPRLHPAEAAEGRRGLGQDIAAGVRYVIGQPVIRTVIAALALLSFGLAVMNTFWAYYLLTTLGASPTAFGVIMGVGGMGSLAGALLAPKIATRFGVGPTIITGFAISPLAQVPLLLAGPGRGWQIVLAGMLAALVLGDRVRGQPAIPTPDPVRPAFPGPDAGGQHHGDRRKPPPGRRNRRRPRGPPRRPGRPRRRRAHSDPPRRPAAHLRHPHPAGHARPARHRSRAARPRRRAVTATASTASAAYWEPLWADGRHYRQLCEDEKRLIGFVHVQQQRLSTWWGGSGRSERA
ncbi:MFS transporter [Streptomyces sp. BR123]|uniref:MFS transporter n=1 Tax=Streptomyces sp. BR123 TaxID=2749828 RepID=UPI0028126BFA|nr:MFS transporter [Streptomyces sp. BR123]